MRSRRRFVLALVCAALAACVAAVWLRPASDPARRAARDAIVRIERGDFDHAVLSADLAFHVSGGSNGTAELSALARTAAGDLPTALARMESVARRRPLDAEPALTAGLLARCAGRSARNGPELRRRAAEWFDDAVRRADAAAVAAGSQPSFGAASLAVAARLASGGLDDAKRRLPALRPTTQSECEQTWMLHAAVAVAAGDFDGAERALHAAPATSPRIEVALARLRAWRAVSGESALTTGLRAWSDGDATGATAALARWIEEHPTDPVALGVLATAAARTGDSAVIARCADLVRRVAPGGPAEPYLLGCHFLARGRSEDASWMLSLAAQRAPGDAHVARALAEAHLIGGRTDESIATCREWLGRNSAGAATALVRNILGVALEHVADDTGAEAQYREALAQTPGDEAALDRLAALLVRTGRAEEAARLVASAVTAGPAPATTRLRHAMTLRAVGRRGDAESLLRAITRDVPTCAAAHLELARLLASPCASAALPPQSAAHEAAAEFASALRLAPDGIEARLGLIELARAESPQAFDACRVALRAESERSPRAALSFAIGVAADRAGEFDEAEARYRDALRREPRLGVASNNLAWLLAVRRGNPVAALPFADDAVRRLPRSPEALDTRGWIRFLLRDFDRAEADIARARDALPHDADVAVRHARALLALGRRDPARAALSAALTTAPGLRRDPLVRSIARSTNLEMDR